MSRWDALRRESDEEEGHRPRPSSGGGRRRPRPGSSGSSGSSGSIRGGTGGSSASYPSDGRSRITGGSISSSGGGTGGQQPAWQPSWRNRTRNDAAIETSGKSFHQDRSTNGNNSSCDSSLDKIRRLDEITDNLRSLVDSGVGDTGSTGTTGSRTADDMEAIRRQMTSLSSLLNEKEALACIAGDSKRLGALLQTLFSCIGFLAAAAATSEDGDDSYDQVERMLYDATSRFIDLCSGAMPFVSATKVDACVTSLVGRMRSIAHLDTTTSSTSLLLGPVLQCLGSVLKAFGSTLAAEETAENVVGPILVPMIESMGATDDNIDSPQIRSALECISALLQQKAQASAILAPLIVDITNEGDERQVDNPLRLRLLSSFQGLLLYKEDEDILIAVCRCLCIALDAIHSIDHVVASARGGKANREAIDLNISSIARRIQALLDREQAGIEYSGGKTLRLAVLHLLSCLARAYPRGIVTQWALFLEEMPSTSSSQLVALIQKERAGAQITEQERIESIRVTNALLTAMPLKIWFGLNSRRGGVARRALPGTSTFAGRVSKTLSSLLEALRNSFANAPSDEFVIVSCQLLEAMVQTQPFDVNDTLAGTFASALNDCSKLLDADTCKASVGIAFVKTLTKGIGGTITPRGSLVPLSKPLRYWLDLDRSHDFLSEMLDLAIRDDLSSNAGLLKDEVCTLISSILRMSPLAVSGKIWTASDITGAVKDLIESGDTQKQLLGLQFMRQYIQGRNNFAPDTKCSSLVCDVFCPYFYQALDNSNAAVRASSATAYGFLQRSDWHRLLTRGPNSGSCDHFHHLLNHCTNKVSAQSRVKGESSASVRSEACKAIGNYCTECLTRNVRDQDEDGPPQQAIVEIKTDIVDVINAMIDVVQDKNAGVRSLALFVVGNLSIALQTHTAVTMTHEDSYKQKLLSLSKSIQNSLQDKNDKVVGNAIRTVGHFLSALRQSDDTRLESEELFYVALDILTRKLKLALDIGSGELKNQSWKQRSFAKKHSWGACHTFGVLLRHASLDDMQCCKHFIPGLSQMIRCVRLAYELSEKITAAAATALKAAPIELWRNISDASTIISDGLAACLILVFKETRGNQKLSSPITEDVRCLLQTFVSASSTTDVVSSFSREDISPGMLDFLYSWMVQEGSKSNSFDAIATALHTNGENRFDVSIEQRFSSRAMFERRREVLPLERDSFLLGNGKEASISLTDTDTDEDEL